MKMTPVVNLKGCEKGRWELNFSSNGFNKFELKPCLFQQRGDHHDHHHQIKNNQETIQCF